MKDEPTGLEYERHPDFNHPFEPGSREHLQQLFEEGAEKNAHWISSLTYDSIWMFQEYAKILGRRLGMKDLQDVEPLKSLQRTMEVCGRKRDRHGSPISRHGIWLIREYVETLENLLEERKEPA